MTKFCPSPEQVSKIACGESIEQRQVCALLRTPMSIFSPTCPKRKKSQLLLRGPQEISYSKGSRYQPFDEIYLLEDRNL